MSDREYYRSMVGPPQFYEEIGARQFCLLIHCGLRPSHRLADIGCGCLRGGGHSLLYLKEKNYHGIEPNLDLLHYGIECEVGQDLIDLKQPKFYDVDDFGLARISDMAGVRYDFVLAQSILSHAGPQLAQRILDQSYLASARHGKFLGTFFQGWSMGNKEGWLGNDIARYRSEEIVKMGYAAGYRKVVILQDYHPMGQIWFLATREP